MIFVIVISVYLTVFMGLWCRNEIKRVIDFVDIVVGSVAVSSFLFTIVSLSNGNINEENIKDILIFIAIFVLAFLYLIYRNQKENQIKFNKDTTTK